MGHLWDALPGATPPILATVLLKNPLPPPAATQRLLPGFTLPD